MAALSRKKIHRFIDWYGPLLAMLACNILFWSATHDIRPTLGVVPPPPGKEELAALKMGDDQFYFRLLALQMQNTGDTYGRFTALKEYDMGRLSQWFRMLDTLDRRSDMMPAMAAYYFSQTQKIEDVRPLVDYLYDHATDDIEHKWWWLLQALYLAQHKLQDMDYALKIAQRLLHPAVPIWAQQMAAVVHEKRGEMEDALAIMESIKDNAEQMDEKDLRYMVYFVKERLKRLDKLQEFESLQPAPIAP